MDQLRPALNWLKRYHFWVLLVLVAGVAMGSWYRAAGALSEDFQANRGKIEQQFKNQANFSNQPFHPNEQINEQQRGEIKKQAESVRRTWEVLYNRQREDVLKWPNELDEDFRQYVEQLEFGDNIPGGLRTHYMDYIERHFAELPKRVGAKMVDENANATEYRSTPEAATPGPSDDQTYLVQWNDENQTQVRQELHWTERPSSLQIWVTQENLWVYHTLLQIIAETNEGADRPANAPVQVIESLQVGRPAAEASYSGGRILLPELPAGMEGEVADDAGYRSISREGEGEGGDERVRLLSNRYLDPEGNPIAVSGESGGAGEFGVEYKRLPVRMRLVMDQRAVPRLIAACANQPLQVEVQQVRINPMEDTSGGGQDRFSSGSRVVEGQAFDPQPNIVPVIVHGIIYVLNKPDTSTLQVAER